MKLDKFEEYVGDDYAVSYVGIRGDEERDGYISSKPNIQAVFPSVRTSGVLMSSISFYIKITLI